MRTTIDLPDDLHDIARAVAHERRESFSQAVADIMRRGLAAEGGASDLYRSPVTGLLVMRGSGQPITHDDVRALEDDE